MFRHQRFGFLVFLFAVCIVLPASAAANPLLENLKINGFLSQGYINSSGNNYFTDSLDGSFQMNEVGLAVSSQVNDKLRVGLQLLSRDLGKSGNNEVRLDWGFADYHMHDLMGFRIGKVKLPMGLYNEGRDSDFLRPMAFLPQSIYDEARRDLLVSYQGVGVYGNLPLWVLGDLDYQAFKGVINFPKDSTQSTLFKMAAQQVIQQNAAFYGAKTVTDVTVDNEYVQGGQLILNTKLSGLRLGISYFEGQSDVYVTAAGGTGGAAAINPYLPSGEITMKDRWIYSFEYVTKWFTLASEYSESDRRQTILGQTNVDAPSQEYYVQLSVNVLENLAITGLWDVYYNNKHDKDGTASATAQRPDYTFWQKDLGVGARYDVDSNWALKAEWHTVDGAGLFMQAYNPPVNNQNVLVKDWNYYILKASFNF